MIWKMGVPWVWAVIFFIATFVGSATVREDDYRTYGTLLLDSLTFPKIVPNGNNYVLVMVAHKGHVGKLSTDGVRDEYFATAEALEAGVSSASILFTQVIVNGAQNRKLATRIGAREDFTYPSFHLYRPGSSESVPFLADGEKESASQTMASVTRWLYKETGIFVGSIGTVDELDKLALEYQAAASPVLREQILGRARTAASSLEVPKNREMAQHYVKAMEKLLTVPTYAKDEVARLQTIVLSDKVADERKKEFRARINIIRRFL